MKNDNYFEVYWINDRDVLIDRFVIRLPRNDSETPGDRIAALTGFARRIDPGRDMRLRTRIHVAAPEGCEAVPLPGYLWSDGTINGPRFIRHLQAKMSGNQPHHFLLHPGMPVLGPDLIDRNGKIEELRGILRATSCHLRAPRRYGKSSLLFRMQEIEAGALLLDLCDIKSTSGFLAKLLKEAMNHETTGRRALLALPELAGWPPALSPPQIIASAYDDLAVHRGIDKITFLDKVFSTLAQAGMILLLDEFSIFVRNLLDDHQEDVEAFLGLFSQVRRHETSPLRVVVAGSSGLSSYIYFMNLGDFFSDLEPVDLPPISPDSARILVEELFYGAGKQPAPPVVERVIEHIGVPVPYFLQTLVHETIAQSGMNTKPGIDDVDQAYLDRLLGPPGNIFFRDYLLRERAYPASLRRAAAAVLGSLARMTEAVPERELLRLFRSKTEGDDDSRFVKLMTCMEEDYDLVQEKEAWFMRSKVLRERLRLGEPL
jgi:hypothetical protein